LQVISAADLKFFNVYRRLFRVREAKPCPPTTRQVLGNTLGTVNEQESREFEYFRRVMLPNGTKKSTESNRLNDLNQAVLPHIARFAESPVKIMDVGVSSGVSTLEWYEHLASQSIRCDITATDLIVYASLVSLGRNLEALIDRDRNILHFDVFGRGTPPVADGLRRFSAGFMRAVFQASMLLDSHLPPLRGHIREAAAGRLVRCEPVALLTSRLAQHESLRVIEDDLQGTARPEFNGAFHVVRAANILNLVYFSEPALVQMVRKLKERLKQNGLLIVCRTDNHTNHATVFEATADSKLRVLSRLGSGSEIEELVTQI
jgi:chemotaxis methyl-accepting protein methylase